MAIVKIQCRDAYVTDLSLLDFKTGMERFKGVRLGSGPVSPPIKPGGDALMLVEDPYFEIDDEHTDPSEFRTFIEESCVFKVRE